MDTAKINETTATKLETTILNSNKLAMDHLRNNDPESSLKLLKHAERILQSANKSNQSNRLRAITMNNLGCFYKRTEQPSLALRYLKQALEFEDLREIVNLAGIHLNICAIKSTLNKHEKAIRHAKLAIHLLTENFKATNNFITTLAIAYHNVGVEYEYLENFESSTLFYKKSIDLALDKLGPTHSLTKSLQKSFTSSYENMKEKIDGRRNGFNRDSPTSIKSRKSSAGIALRERRKRKNGTPKAKYGPYEERSLEKRRPSKKKLSNSLMGHVRFLVGERLQPMFKDYDSFNNSQPIVRNQKQQKHLKGSLSLTTPKARSNSNIAQPKGQNNKLTSAISSIDAKLLRLKTQLNDFVDRCQPLKELAESKEESILDSKGSRITSTPSSLTIDQLLTSRVPTTLESNEKSNQPQKPPLASSHIPTSPKVSLKNSQSPKNYTKPPHIPSVPITPKMRNNHLKPLDKSRRDSSKDKKTISYVIKPQKYSIFDSTPSSRIRNKHKTPQPRTKSSLKYYSKFIPKIILIQSHIRRFLVRRKLSKRARAAKIIQKNWRMHGCYKLYKQIILAIIFIQAMWRGYRVRKLLAKRI
jgi:tetratricopeptide (TPR) repeat protein